MHEQEAALASRDYAGHQLLTGRCGEDAARPFLGLLGAVAQREGGGTKGGQRNLGGEHRLMHNHFDHHLFTQGRGNVEGLVSLEERKKRPGGGRAPEGVETTEMSVFLMTQIDFEYKRGTLLGHLSSCPPNGSWKRTLRPHQLYKHCLVPTPTCYTLYNGEKMLTNIRSLAWDLS